MCHYGAGCWRAKGCISQLSNPIKINNFAPNCHIHIIFFFKSTNSSVLYPSTTFFLSSEVFFLLKRPLTLPHLLIHCNKKGIVSVDDHEIISFVPSKCKLCICVMFIRLVSPHSQRRCCTNLSYDKCFNILPPPSPIPIPISTLDPSYSYFDPEHNVPKTCICLLWCGLFTYVQ